MEFQRKMNLKCYPYSFHIITILFAVFIISCKSTLNKSKITYCPVAATIWHFKILDDNHVIYADYDGNVGKKGVNTSENDWVFPTGAFVFDLSIADLENDGTIETVFVTAQGEIIVLNQEGKKRWSFSSKLPLFNVATGNFTGDSKREIAGGGIDRHVRVFSSTGKMIAKREWFFHGRFKLTDSRDEPDGPWRTVASRTIET